MVSSNVILAFQINCVVCLGVPLGLAVFLFVKGRRSVLLPMLTGAAAFVVSQFILRLPLLNLLGQADWMRPLNANVWFSALFAGLTAGLFEEFARFAGFKLLKYRRGWSDGVSFGGGHGGAEAILLVGLSNINAVTVCRMINNGEYEVFMRRAGHTDEEIAEGIRQFTSLVPAEVLMGGLERIFTMAIQIALTLLVLYAVRSGKFRYVWLAVGLHMLVDASAGLLANALGWNVYLVEAVIGVYAVLSVLFIFYSRKLLAPVDPKSTMAFLKLPDQPKPLTTGEQLEAAQKPEMPESPWRAQKGKKPPEE